MAEETMKRYLRIIMIILYTNNPCWLMISEVLWHSPDSDLIEFGVYLRPHLLTWIDFNLSMDM